MSKLEFMNQFRLSSLDFRRNPGYKAQLHVLAPKLSHAPDLPEPGYTYHQVSGQNKTLSHQIHTEFCYIYKNYLIKHFKINLFHLERKQNLLQSKIYTNPKYYTQYAYALTHEMSALRQTVFSILCQSYILVQILKIRIT